MYIICNEEGGINVLSHPPCLQWWPLIIVSYQVINCLADDQIIIRQECWDAERWFHHDDDDYEVEVLSLMGEVWFAASVALIVSLLYLQDAQPQSHRKCLYFTSQNFSP